MLNIYRASAGSGKTYRLTEEYIHLLFSSKLDRPHRRILAVTFTNKATDEMKNRILNELYDLSRGEESNYRKGLCKAFKLDEAEVNAKAQNILIAILQDFSSFSISTIDKFFQQVIRSFARDIGVHGGYNLELDTTDTLEQAVDHLFLDLSKDENKQLLGWLTQFAEDRIEQSETWNLRGSMLDLGKEIFKESYQHKAEDTSQKLHDREFLLAYRTKLRKIKTDFENRVEATAQSALDLMSAHGLTHAEFSYGTTKTFDKLIGGKYEVSQRFKSYADDLSLCYTKKTPEGIKAAIESIYNNGFQAAVLEIIRLLQEDIVYYNSADIILKHINTLGILSDLAVQIKMLTEEQNSMLISDSNMLLNKIIDNSDTPFVYEKTGIYIDHFMFDEFQDTSRLQWKNFSPLVSNSLSSGKTNLIVGDVKQSIYRWRNSDWKLLDEQLMLDYRPEQIKEVDLDTNWRSDKHIVAFNNAFFSKASVLLQQKLNLELEGVLSVYPELSSLTQKVEHAYKNTHQNVKPNAGLGRVELNFIAKDENEDGWTEEALNRLPALLEDLQTRGYQPHDIAFLVRTNAEEQKVIRKLLHYKTTPEAKPDIVYDVMGNEGLAVGSAASVRFILGVLQLFVHPYDSVQRTIVNYEYARATKNLSEKDALSLCFSVPENKELFSALFSEAENEQIVRLKNRSLFDMIEGLILLFGIGDWHQEAVFVQAFQDLVFKFATTRTADLYSFLKWWEKSGEKQSISTPDNQAAVRIMTIHKSKGLDFKVTILPFCDWGFDKKTNMYSKNILWCEPTEAPFNELGLLPVEYSSKLANSIFAKNYFDEQMHQYIDNLNVAYVAFTRARNELICFLPQGKTEVKSVEKLSSLSDMILYCSQDNLFGDDQSLNEQFESDETYFSLGQVQEIAQTATSQVEQSNAINIYPTVTSANRLRMHHYSLDYLDNNKNLTESKLNYGIVMHDVLCKIQQKSDQDFAIESILLEGRINKEESVFIKNELEKFWAIPQTKDWFAEDVKVLNEATILTPDADFYRPDRVIIKGDLATVIDYKFGDYEHDKYKNQVKQYMDLIAEMGYQVEGFICYVSLSKVVEVV